MPRRSLQPSESRTVSSGSDHDCLSPHRIALRSSSFARDAECPQCQESEAQLRSWLKVLRHSDRLVATEYITRHKLLFELFSECQTHQERVQRVQQDSLFHHWGLCTLLRQGAREATGSPHLGQSLLELATVVATLLDPDVYDRISISRLQGRVAAETIDSSTKGRST